MSQTRLCRRKHKQVSPSGRQNECLCNQKWVAWLPMLPFIHDDKK